MRRPNRKDEVCFKSLEEALAKNPETYGRLDLLCAGWPCQGNSIAGKRQGHKDERSGLWKEVARCLRLFKPKWFLGENVPGLLSVNDGRDFSEIISDLQKIGYGVAWRILDSQYFGVAQRRRRLFIVGYFGAPCPPEILFEPKGGSGDDKTKQKVGYKGLCISTRDGERQNPTQETYVASTIRKSGEFNSATGGGGGNFVASTIGAFEGRKAHPTTETHVARAINAGRRGIGAIQTETFLAETNPDRKRKVAGIPKGLDSVRGVVIGNAVTVNVAEWIGRRIVKCEKGLL